MPDTRLTAPSTSSPRTTIRFPPSALMRPLCCQLRSDRTQPLSFLVLRDALC
jgi:hypothetical protein